jgi:hypothetical protein
MEEYGPDPFTRVTFRRRAGKAHRGFLYMAGPYKGALNATCGCPGSASGWLTKGAVVIAKGWERANCCPNNREKTGTNQ